MRFFIAAPVLVAFACASAVARAEETPALTSPAGGEQAPATLQGLSEEVAAQALRLLAELPRERLDLALVLSADIPAPRSGAEGLAVLLRRLVAAAFARGGELRAVRSLGHDDEAWADEAGARARAGQGGFEILLHGRISLEQGHLVVEGRVFRTERHIWRELVEPEGALLGQVYGRRRANAEIRHYLAPLPSSDRATLREIPLGRPGYLDLEVADLDGDDIAELVLLRRRVLEVRRLEAGGTTLVARHPLVDLRPAPTPSRDPFGTIAIGPAGEDGTRPIAFRTSDHAGGMILRFADRSLRADGEVSDFPLQWSSGELECATARAGQSLFETLPTTCGSLSPLRAPARYFDRAVALVPRHGAPGGTARATALSDGRVVLSWQDRNLATLSSLGTAVAVTDLDDDGVAEVLVSSDSEPGEPDELTLLQLDPGGGEGSRRSLGAVSGSVWVAAAGDVDDDGLRELLAISESGTGAQLVVVE